MQEEGAGEFEAQADLHPWVCLCLEDGGRACEPRNAHLWKPRTALVGTAGKWRPLPSSHVELHSVNSLNVPGNHLPQSRTEEHSPLGPLIFGPLSLGQRNQASLWIGMSEKTNLCL